MVLNTLEHCTLSVLHGESLERYFPILHHSMWKRGKKDQISQVINKVLRSFAWVTLYLVASLRLLLLGLTVFLIFLANVKKIVISYS